MVFAIAVFTVTAIDGHAAGPVSDIESVGVGLPDGFKRPQIVVYPLIDQRRLEIDEQVGTSATEMFPPEAWQAFLDTLGQAPNLSIRRPANTRRSLQNDRAYQSALALAVKAMNRGYRDFREVRLESAVESLETAIAALLALEHQVVRPREVSRACLTLGLAHLEQKNDSSAESAFRQALLIDPSLRLRPGYDHPKALLAFARARQALTKGGPPPPPGFSARSPSNGGNGARYEIRARALPDRLELTIRSPVGVRVESEPLGDDPAEDGSRLASRVIACLPFGHAPNVAAFSPELTLDAGFGSFLFARAPVSAFANLGVGVNLSYLAAPSISMEVDLALSNSNRDRQEHLRRDVGTWRVRAGPGFQWQGGRFRLFAHVGVEVAGHSAFEFTTNPACKHFSPADELPTVLCDFDREIEHNDSAWFLGASVSMGARVTLVRQFYIAGRVNAAGYAFESQRSALSWPVGGYIGLGYRML